MGISISSQGGGDPHDANEKHHYYRQDSAPAGGSPLDVGDIWSDTTNNLIKRCTNASTPTFTSIEGGGSGSLTTIKEGGSQVGGADIVTLDFLVGFDLTEDPDTLIKVALDLSELSDQDLQIKLGSLTAATELTISSGDITATQSFHKVDTESDDSTDDLIGINGGSAGDLLIIRPENDARTVVVKHNGSAAAADNILLRGGVDKSLTEIEDTLFFIYDATLDTNGAWLEVPGIYFDDATSNPLIDADSAADGTENSPARKDHVHPKHHAKYTDAEAISAVEGEATLDLAGDVTIDGAKTLKVDVIDEKDSAAGVTIDSVLLKDGVVTVGDVAFDDATSDPLPADSTVAADGTENSVARKDHRHLATAASATTSGISELATATETSTGTDAARTVTPDGLAGSKMGRIRLQMVVFDFTTDVATGDGKFFFHVDDDLAGYNLTGVHAEVITAGTTNTTDIQLRNVTQSADILSTKLTIDSGETGSDTAAAAAVISVTEDDMQENDVIAVDVDAVSTTAPKGLIISLKFELP